MISNTLYDKDFLLKLDKNRNKTIYARITALQFNESPIEYIEGRVTQGSINIDGASAVRRTCSLSIICQDFDYNDYYWGMNTKFKLEVGVENTIDPDYPDIIWFPQGIYLITNFSTSHSPTGLNINISGKDKMCLLNGEVGGSLESSVDFGTIHEESADGIWTIRKIPIVEIIRNMVHVYAGEPYWNIVINDLDSYGVELLEYRYDIPMYLYRYPSSQQYHNTLIENTTNTFALTRGGQQILLKDIPNTHLEMLLDDVFGVAEPQPVWDKDGNEYYLAKIDTGQAGGYRKTDLTYPGDLIANIGESITSVLDKIRNMLVEFEYFYDLNGQFVFQKKRSFINTLWTPVTTDEQGNAAVTQSLELSSASAYTFSGSELITAFNNTPNILNMRNDYSIWGERETITGAKVPIHMRYAIDIIPKYYKTIRVEESEIQAYNEKHGTQLKYYGQREFKINEPYVTEHGTTTSYNCDWREILFQMAQDYYRYNFLDDFELRIIEANLDYYPTGQTGYEKYYIDIYSFWRDLYDPDFEANYNDDKTELSNIQSETLIPNKSKSYWEDQIERIQIDLRTLNNQLNELNEKSNTTNTQLQDKYNQIVQKRKDLNNAKNQLVILQNRESVLKDRLGNLDERKEDFIGHSYSPWNKQVYERPETLNFWLDFLGSDNQQREGDAHIEGADLQQFNVKNMGSRSKSINDTTIKSIYFRDTPTVMFTTNITEEEWLPGFRYIQVPDKNIDSMFKISAQDKSAKEKLDELLYQHGYCIENVSITTIPVYYLDANTRVYIYDEKSNIYGDYIVSKISIPLTYNGTMSITATKAAETLF